jgi:metal-responsive CopG/Arc/MetJ family transcriptional regulator
MDDEKRPGPGRPPTYLEPRTRMALELPHEMVQRLNVIAGVDRESRTAWVEAALGEALEYAYWRLEARNTITAALAVQHSARQLSKTEYEADLAGVEEAYHARNHTALLNLLTRYDPDGWVAAKYPGNSSSNH